MKKILDGIRYDTDTAEPIGTAAANYPREDQRYWKATLYRTPRSKRFFIAGEGGAMSRFAQSSGKNSWNRGADIIPMDESQALEWAEQNLPQKDISILLQKENQ